MRAKTKMNATLNAEQKLFVIPSGSGYSCLGFQVCEDRAIRLGSELVKVCHSSGFRIEQPAIFETLERYEQYQRMVNYAREHHRKTGYQFQCELHPQLKGLEGKRVEVVNANGETHRFLVGKSTGWIPCHLAIARRNCLEGYPVDSRPFKSVRIVPGGKQ
jgi:hypothetical protein